MKMKVKQSVTVLSVTASCAAIVAKGELGSPAILDVGQTPVCGVTVSENTLMNPCGHEDNPCAFYRKGSCSGRYHVTNVDTGRTIVAASIESSNSQEVAFPQQAWKALCPYQCLNKTCVNDPSSCPEKYALYDYFDQYQRLAPGSTAAGVSSTFAWKQLNPNGVGDDHNVSDVGTLIVDKPMFAKGWWFKSGDADYEGNPIPQSSMIDTQCGTHVNPCLAAGPSDYVGKCYDITIATNGLDDPAVCNKCPSRSKKMFIKVVNQASQLSIGQAGWKMLCPWMCQGADGTSNTNVCPVNFTDCVKGMKADQMQNAMGNWVEYELAGSIFAEQQPILSIGRVGCYGEPTLTTGAPVTDSNGSVIATQPNGEDTTPATGTGPVGTTTTTPVSNVTSPLPSPTEGDGASGVGAAIHIGYSVLVALITTALAVAV